MADEARSEDSGGMAALQVASSHLSTLVSGSDAMDAKATFIVAVSVALFGVYFGSVLSMSGAMTEPDWIALAAPGIVTLIVLLLGAWTVRPRQFDQFVRPRDMLESHITGSFSNDALAWSYVRSIANATETVSAVLDQKSSGVGWLAFLTALDLVAMVTSAAVWLT